MELAEAERWATGKKGLAWHQPGTCPAPQSPESRGVGEKVMQVAGWGLGSTGAWVGAALGDRRGCGDPKTMARPPPGPWSPGTSGPGWDRKWDLKTPAGSARPGEGTAKLHLVLGEQSGQGGASSDPLSAQRAGRGLWSGPTKTRITSLGHAVPFETRSARVCRWLRV